MPVTTIKADTIHVTIYDTVALSSDTPLLTSLTEIAETEDPSNMIERDREIERLIAEGKAFERIGTWLHVAFNVNPKTFQRAGAHRVNYSTTYNEVEAIKVLRRARRNSGMLLYIATKLL